MELDPRTGLAVPKGTVEKETEVWTEDELKIVRRALQFFADKSIMLATGLPQMQVPPRLAIEQGGGLPGDLPLYDPQGGGAASQVAGRAASICPAQGAKVNDVCL